MASRALRSRRRQAAPSRLGSLVARQLGGETARSVNLDQREFADHESSPADPLLAAADLRELRHRRRGYDRSRFAARLARARERATPSRIRHRARYRGLAWPAYAGTAGAVRRLFRGRLLAQALVAALRARRHGDPAMDRFEPAHARFCGRRGPQAVACRRDLWWIFHSRHVRAGLAAVDLSRLRTRAPIWLVEPELPGLAARGGDRPGRDARHRVGRAVGLLRGSSPRWTPLVGLGDGLRFRLHAAPGSRLPGVRRPAVQRLQAPARGARARGRP